MIQVKAVRFDDKGHWRDQAHRSSMQGLGESWEKGVSCYIEDGTGKGLLQLYEYAVQYRGVQMPSDVQGQQMTVFAGEYHGAQEGTGSDGEDLVYCTRTLAQIDAVEVMRALMAAMEAAEDTQIDEGHDRQWLEHQQLRICAGYLASIQAMRR